SQVFNNKKTKIAITLFFLSFFLFFVVYSYSLSIRKKLSVSKTSSSLTNNLPSQSNLSTQPNQSNSDFPLDKKYSFAKFNLEKTQYSANLPDYKITLSDISNLADFDKEKPFTDSQKQALINTNFFITSNLDSFYGQDPDAYTSRFDDWTDLYDTIGGSYFPSERYPENSVFVSSDFLLHVYHRLLEKEFEYIEQTRFYPALKEITDQIFDQANKDYQVAKDKSNKESLERIIAFFLVPKSIIDSAYQEFDSNKIDDQKLDTKQNILSILESQKDKIPSSAYLWAKQEMSLILDQKEMKKSPIFGKLMAEENLEFLHDYTQYGPRSHYNKNSVLRAYFRAMMWYGRTNFLTKSAGLTRDAINISYLITKTNQIKNWQKIYDPTAFFVGIGDDLGIYQYNQIITKLKLNISDLSDSEVGQVQEQAKNYSSPMIMSSAIVGDAIFDLSKEELQEKTKGFRFMGQRFTPDAFIFSSLTQGDEKPDPETGEKLPSSTTALMVMSTMGNQTARPLVDQWINQNAPQSKSILAKKLNSLTNSFTNTPEEIWTQNIYWSWLYSIKALFNYPQNLLGYPEFMKNNDWQHKSLQTALGSWTELKHDTLLYAKQSYAEYGAGGPQKDPLPVPKSYVEPNIPFLDRLLAMSQMTKQGLESKGLLETFFIGRNDDFIEAIKFFRQIAVKQLQNELISDEEFEKLRLLPGKLGYVLMPLPNETPTENHARSALIADVHTDVLKGEILYEANGIPNYIYVAIKDKNGTRLTKGLVFSYYEFTDPIGDRLTDEKWRQINYSLDKSKLPLLPQWSSELVK
ncbi:hypothetical protein DRH14_05215, partial [Candidatus Shapirobacteria bacterium]